ncbi:hypothetical protein EniLVp02_0029 [Vibrio phage EniLVp02]
MIKLYIKDLIDSGLLMTGYQGDQSPVVIQWLAAGLEGITPEQCRRYVEYEKRRPTSNDTMPHSLRRALDTGAQIFTSDEFPGEQTVPQTGDCIVFLEGTDRVHEFPMFQRVGTGECYTQLESTGKTSKVYATHEYSNEFLRSITHTTVGNHRNRAVRQTVRQNAKGDIVATEIEAFDEQGLPLLDFHSGDRVDRNIQWKRLTDKDVPTVLMSSVGEIRRYDEQNRLRVISNESVTLNYFWCGAYQICITATSAEGKLITIRDYVSLNNGKTLVSTLYEHGKPLMRFEIDVKTESILNCSQLDKNGNVTTTFTPEFRLVFDRLYNK